LRGGDDIAIRPIRADDRERLVQAFRSLDRRSIYRRFFFNKRAMSDSEVRYLTESEDARSVVLVATKGKGAQEAIVGLGQYFRRGDAAEVAFAVREEFQGRGIAARLLQRLVRIACGEGVARFEAEVLAENGPMLSVFRHSGLTVSESEEGGVIHVALTLDTASQQSSAP
jgi:RimJ/RimL family protein N-acetyltransferase